MMYDRVSMRVSRCLAINYRSVSIIVEARREMSGSDTVFPGVPLSDSTVDVT